MQEGEFGLQGQMVNKRRSALIQATLAPSQIETNLYKALVIIHTTVQMTLSERKKYIRHAGNVGDRHFHVKIYLCRFVPVM
jgi:hypothetical protein